MNRPNEDFPIWSITPMHLYLCDIIQKCIAKDTFKFLNNWKYFFNKYKVNSI